MDVKTCFATNDQFLEHHGGEPMEPGDLYGPLSNEDYKASGL